MPPPPVTSTFDLLTLKVVSDSRVTCATPVPLLVFLGLSVLDLGPMYAIDVRQTSNAHHRLMSPTLVVGHNKKKGSYTAHISRVGIRSTIFFRDAASHARPFKFSSHLVRVPRKIWLLRVTPCRGRRN